MIVSKHTTLQEGVPVKRMLLALVAGVCMLLAAAGPASAAKPQVDTNIDHYAGSADCGAFNDDFQGTSHVRSTEWANGTLHIHVVTVEYDRNSVTEKTVRVHQAYTVVVEPSGEYRYNGQVYIAGGYSKVIHDTGTVRFAENGDILKVAGPHTVLSGGLEPFCQALS
jgi:hypothetical protein